ncbi:hypothetical protein [Burkholderia lata]|uniref:hypothetical protein n=1 Tax=Burkholderia lata (strain ATCC 17760 / DSM 23089 / LMG 22485 / NCIMB 9086 / R18194 / 383) TaxID=482957 RepID=UPI00242E3F29|nr:hypothetical protein [Burkholderia lata]
MSLSTGALATTLESRKDSEGEGFALTGLSQRDGTQARAGECAEPMCQHQWAHKQNHIYLLFKKELDVAAEFISAHAGYTSRWSGGSQFLPGKITECFAATRY